MEKPLKKYRDEMLGRLLDFLWRQWSALGVAGRGAEVSGCVVDPEALFAFTCTLGRYDPRVFDEALDWLAAYERFINAQRLRTLFKEDLFSGTTVAGAVARFLGGRTRQKRWEHLAALPGAAKRTGLFRLKDGRDLPVAREPDAAFLGAGLVRDAVRLRGYSVFRTTGNGALLLRLRALLGVGARCEILLFLITHARGFPSEIAAETHYAQKTIHDALDDMALSGFVSSSKDGRERVCRLDSCDLAHALLEDARPPQWVNWPVLLGAIEKAWMDIDALAALRLDPILEASQMRKIAVQLMNALHGQKSIPAVFAPKSNDLAECMRPVIQSVGLLQHFHA